MKFGKFEQGDGSTCHTKDYRGAFSLLGIEGLKVVSEPGRLLDLVKTVELCK
jgi:hypothetical protein